MNELIAFLTKYKNTLLFILLEVISFVFIFQQKNYNKTWFVNSTSLVVGKVYSVSSSVKNFASLGKVNAELAEKNAELLSNPTNIQYFTVPVEINDTIVVSDTLYSDTTEQFIYLPAKVVYNTFTKSRNYLIINKGKKHGFYNDMGVVTHNGILGKVVDVSKNYALIMPIINADLKISAKLKKEGHFGTVTWADAYSFKSAKLEDIPNHVNVKPGDTVVSTGYSLVYPENNLIGYVEKVSKPEGSNFLDIKISLSNDFSNLNYVYGITQKSALDGKLMNWLKISDNE